MKKSAVVEITELSAAEQVAVLGRAAALLASSAEFDATLTHTITACLPALGDFGFFDVVVEGTALAGTVRRTAAAYRDPEVEAILSPTQWVRSERTDVNLCALSSGVAGLHPDIDDAWYREIAVNEGHLELLRRLAFRSMLTVPMRYQGELVGALTLFYGRSCRRHTDDHRRFAEDLAALAVPVVVNARLVERYRRAELALRLSEERLRLAADAGRLGLWDWNIVEDRITWTDRVYDLHGLPPGQFGGSVAAFAALVHPDDRARVQTSIDAAIRDGTIYEVEFRSQRPDGTTRWLSTRADIVRDEAGAPIRMLGATQDVTERVLLLGAEREARREAEAARRRLEALASAGERFTSTLEPAEMIDAIGSVIVPGLADWCHVDLFDDTGELQPVFTRGRTAELTARGSELARSWRAPTTRFGSLEWIAKKAEPLHAPITASMRADAPANALGDFIREQELCEAIAVPLIARGRTLGAMAALLDRGSAASGRTFSDEDFALLVELARRTALALDNARLYSDAEHARRDAESASRAKDEFLAILGHELRNPLAPIVSALELMKQRGQTELRREREIIERQVTHLSRLVDDLLDVSRIVRGKVNLDLQPLDMATVVDKAIEMTRPLFTTREIELTSRLSPAWVDADPLRLAQVVGNLLTNAAKFTPPRGRVEIELADTTGDVVLTIRDTGQGIAPELLPDIFGLFVQGPQALDRRQGGLGLGLAIVANLVDLHGGKVEAHSAGPGAGSTFVVRLPRIAQPQARAGAPSAMPATHGASGRILVVDDNEDAAELLAELLRRSGYDVDVATSAVAALDAVANGLPRLALLDIGLPGIDGYQLATRLRALPGANQLLLIAVTGYGRDSDRERARAAGFDAHLTKPVHPVQLLEALDKLLAR
jgi:PAS domain S-box-containing protein